MEMKIGEKFEFYPETDDLYQELSDKLGARVTHVQEFKNKVYFFTANETYVMVKMKWYERAIARVKGWFR